MDSATAIVALVIVGILAAGCCAFIYAMYRHSMEFSARVWEEAERFKAGALQDTLEARSATHNHIMGLLSHIENLLRDREGEIRSMEKRLTSTVDAAVVRIANEIKDGKHPTPSLGTPAIDKRATPRNPLG